MSDEVKRFFNGLLQKYFDSVSTLHNIDSDFYFFRISGLKVIIISDRDGVPLLRLSKDNKLPELGTRQSFLATFSVANEQGSKMMLGRNKSIVAMYKSTLVSLSAYLATFFLISCVFQVVQMNKSPLIVTFVGSENCNTGHILSLEDEIDKYLDELSAVVENQ